MTLGDRLKALKATVINQVPATAAAARLGRLSRQNRIHPNPSGGGVRLDFWAAASALQSKGQLSAAQHQALQQMKRFIDGMGTASKALVLADNAQGPVKQLMFYDSDIQSPLKIQMYTMDWNARRGAFV